MLRTPTPNRHTTNYYIDFKHEHDKNRNAGKRIRQHATMLTFFGHTKQTNETNKRNERTKRANETNKRNEQNERTNVRTKPYIKAACCLKKNLP